jgi:dynein heavy chain
MVYARQHYDTDYMQSMNSVLTQELEKYNILIRLIKSSLKELKMAIAGEALLSPALEAALTSMTLNIIPGIWKAKSFNSLKPLGSYIKDVQGRLEFFEDWLRNGIPRIFWINKFFFAHGFLTGARQNYARKFKIPIDTMDLDYKVIADENATAPDDGVYVKGMYMEGCKWDPSQETLAESDPKILYTQCPMIWFIPIKAVDKNTTGIFDMPLYLTMDRKGILATTGHSTNFVGLISIPSAQQSSHWTKRGAALLCALND